MSEIDFNIELPDGWEDQTSYYFRGPEIEDFPHEIIVNVDRHIQTDDIDEYSRDRISPIVQSMNGIEVLKDQEITKAGGNPAYEFIFKWMPSDDIREIHNYLFVIKEQLGFMILIRFSRKSYKMLRNQFKEIVEEILPGTYGAQD